MSSTKQINYLKHKEQLIERLALGSHCFNCLASNICKALCEERKIDVSRQDAPCVEAWKKWCNSVKDA